MRKLLAIILISTPCYASVPYYEFVELTPADFKKLNIFASQGNRATDERDFFVHAPNSYKGVKLDSVSIELWQKKQMVFSSQSVFSVYENKQRAAFPILLNVTSNIRVKTTLCYAQTCLDISSIRSLPIKEPSVN